MSAYTNTRINRRSTLTQSAGRWRHTHPHRIMGLSAAGEPRLVCTISIVGCVVVFRPCALPLPRRPALRVEQRVQTEKRLAAFDHCGRCVSCTEAVPLGGAGLTDVHLPVSLPVAMFNVRAVRKRRILGTFSAVLTSCKLIRVIGTSKHFVAFETSVSALLAYVFFPLLLVARPHRCFRHVCGRASSGFGGTQKYHSLSEKQERGF